MVNFLLTWFLFLLASSVVITAFFCITRGYTETRPDGTERRYGKILKGYYFFWFRQKGKTQIQYVDDELANLIDRFKTWYNEPVTMIGDIFKAKSVTTFTTTKNFLEVIPLLRYKFRVNFNIEAQTNGTLIVSAYEDQPVYYFPEWLRTVMAGCITCTPTVYGNIIYWVTIACFKESVLYSSLFNCFNNVYVGVILVWLAYWISLAWLNTVLWNIYNKN